MGSFLTSIQQRLQSFTFKDNANCTESPEVKHCRESSSSSDDKPLKKGMKKSKQSPTKIKLDENAKWLDLSKECILNTDALEERLKRHSNPSGVVAFILTGNERLERFPTAISRYDQLMKLDLSDNYICEIHWSIVYLKKLEILNLAKNAIRKIPKTIGHLVSLKEFDISDNPIVCLPTELLHLHHLEQLNVSGCKYLISPTIADCFEGWEKISECLQKREGRQNLWQNDTACYSEGFNGSFGGEVKSLQSCCIDVIMSCKIDFLQSQTVPTLMKNDLHVYESISNSRLKVSKCSKCNGYFSSVELFDAHTCV